MINTNLNYSNKYSNKKIENFTLDNNTKKYLINFIYIFIFLFLLYLLIKNPDINYINIIINIFVKKCSISNLNLNKIIIYISIILSILISIFNLIFIHKYQYEKPKLNINYIFSWIIFIVFIIFLIIINLPNVNYNYNYIILLLLVLIFLIGVISSNIDKLRKYETNIVENGKNKTIFERKSFGLSIYKNYKFIILLILILYIFINIIIVIFKRNYYFNYILFPFNFICDNFHLINNNLITISIALLIIISVIVFNYFILFNNNCYYKNTKNCYSCNEYKKMSKEKRDDILKYTENEKLRNNFNNCEYCPDNNAPDFNCKEKKWSIENGNIKYKDNFKVLLSFQIIFYICCIIFFIINYHNSIFIRLYSPVNILITIMIIIISSLFISMFNIS